MKQAQWVHVLGNTWYMESQVTIPVYFLNEREVVLLDSGYAKWDRAPLNALLQERDLHVWAILGSHSHNDHNGNHAYFQSTHQAKIILRDIEAAIVSDFSLMKAAYFPATTQELEQEMPHLLLKADQIFSAETREISIGSATFGLVPLPGHTPGHTCIVTPDDVLYVGDTLLSHAVLQEAKLPSTLDWAKDMESKRRLLSEHHSRYILAHKGMYTEITTIAEENLSDKVQCAVQIRDWLCNRDVWLLNEIEQFLWKQWGLHGKSFLTRATFQRNVRCVLEYLAIEGMVRREFRDGVYWYWAVK